MAAISCHHRFTGRGRWPLALCGGLESMDLMLVQGARCACLAVLGGAILAFHSQPTAGAGVRGRFDFPTEALAVPVAVATDMPAAEVPLFEVNIPISFRTTKGQPEEVVQL